MNEILAIYLAEARRVAAQLADYSPPPTPLITSDAVAFGVLMGVLGLIFYTGSRKSGFWAKFIPISPCCCCVISFLACSARFILSARKAASIFITSPRAICCLPPYSC